MHKAAQAYSRISSATSWVREIETQAPPIDIDGNLAGGSLPDRE